LCPVSLVAHRGQSKRGKEPSFKVAASVQSCYLNVSLVLEAAG
jgi:hypothetical protein